MQKAIDIVTEIFLETNFANRFTAPGLFKLQAYLFELETDKFKKWFDKDLRVPLADNIWINSVNTKTDKQEIYGYEDFKESGYGEFISRSIAIPGFIDKGIYVDGGVAENPCLSQWKDEELPIFVSQLMMPYRVQPKGRISKLFYSWERKAFESYLCFIESFPNRVCTIYPHIDDVDSTDFAIKKREKEKMIMTAYHETSIYLKDANLIPKVPTPIALALSGGGIRSGGHIGVVQALVENNLIPVKWSGTSGGAAFAVLFAGFSK